MRTVEGELTQGKRTRRGRARFKIPDAHRDRGMHWVAGSGSGKSLSLGLVAFRDFERGIPQVLFDPSGQMIDAFLTEIAKQDAATRRRQWRRIHYHDMAGTSTHIPSWPLLIEHPGDSRQDVADRFLETLRKVDPHLETASVQGFNALAHIGSRVCVILSSLGLQLDEAANLLDHPNEWHDRLYEAQERFPEAREAVEFIRQQYLPLTPARRYELSHMFRSKLDQLIADPTSREMFCSSSASLDLRDVVDARQTVLIDFRHETNQRKRLFKTRWVFESVLAYILARGPGKHRPLAIHFDEITELTNQASLDHDLFAADLDYLFNVIQRNYSVWISAAHQQMWQVSAKTGRTLMSLGTQVIGVVSDVETATQLAKLYAPCDPHRVKRYENVWASESRQIYFPDGSPSHKDYDHLVLERRPIDFPMDEQYYIASRAFMRLPPFTFLVKTRDKQELQLVSMKGSVGDPWPTDHPLELAYIRHQLGLQHGLALEARRNRAESFDTIESSHAHEISEHDETIDADDWDTSFDVTHAPATAGR